MVDRIYVETVDDSYSICYSPRKFRQVLQREKGNPHVVLIKKMEKGREKVLFSDPKRIKHKGE